MLVPRRAADPERVRWVETHVYPNRDEAGRVREVVFVQSDVTARVKAEAASARLTATLREQDRKKDEFLAILAHELRNPLAPLRSGIDLLARAPSRETIERVRGIMDRQLKQVVRLVDDLLDLSRVTAGKITLTIEDVELSAVVDDAVTANAALVDRAGLTVRTSLPPGVPRVRGDRVRLAQVLGNLLHNAAKFTAPGGHIEVRAEAHGPVVELRVTDTGVGLSPELVESIFELFVQGPTSQRGSFGGLGIGLTLVRRLVELHGGRVWAESAGVGQGATFVVELPTPLAGRAEDSKGARPAETRGRARTVLVVDDNVDAAEMLASLLVLDGHDARPVGGARRALELARAFRPEVAIVDLGMPDIDGFELARRLHAVPETAATALVALTGWGQPGDRARTRDAGFVAHLTKPVELDELRAMFASLAGSR